MTRGLFRSPTPWRRVRAPVPAVAPGFALGLLAALASPLAVSAQQVPGEAAPAPAPSVVAAAAPALATPMGSTPQAADTPEGIWWGVGVGLGALKFTCDICAADRDRGASLYGLVGAYASPALRVALEGGGWTRESADEGVRESIYRLGLTGFLHPDPESGFHLLAGLGWVGYRADDTRYDSGALSVGLGWDFPVFGDWRMGNAARIEASSFGRFRNDDDVVASDVGLSMIRFEVTLRRR